MPLPLVKDTIWPIPDWKEVEKQEPEQNKHEFWLAAGDEWIDLLSDHLGDTYQVTESPHFWLISSQPAKSSIEQIKWLEAAMQKILRMLGTLGNSSPLGKCPVLLFANDEDYYDYISNYYEEGDWATSGGIYISNVYGHFAIPQSSHHSLHAVLAHELTHALMENPNIPAWLNEGLTQLCEEAVIGYLQIDYEEIREHIDDYWNEKTIQGFWDGSGFKEQGEGQTLCYHLSQLLVYRLIQDRERFDEFAANATFEDAGEKCLHNTYGIGLSELVETALGEGVWRYRKEVGRPKPK